MKKLVATLLLVVTLTGCYYMPPTRLPGPLCSLSDTIHIWGSCEQRASDYFVRNVTFSNGASVDFDCRISKKDALFCAKSYDGLQMCLLLMKKYKAPYRYTYVK